MPKCSAFADALEPAMHAVDAGRRHPLRDDLRDARLRHRTDGSAIPRSRSACTARDATARSSFGTEAGLFQRAGMPTVICGPGHIAQAHQPDEYVSLAQLAAGERFLLGVDDGRHLSAGGRACVTSSGRPLARLPRSAAAAVAEHVGAEDVPAAGDVGEEEAVVGVVGLGDLAHVPRTRAGAFPTARSKMPSASRSKCSQVPRTKPVRSRSSAWLVTTGGASFAGSALRVEIESSVPAGLRFRIAASGSKSAPK